jgi:hypothetical protein
MRLAKIHTSHLSVCNELPYVAHCHRTINRRPYSLVSRHARKQLQCTAARLTVEIRHCLPNNESASRRLLEMKEVGLHTVV